MWLPLILYNNLDTIVAQIIFDWRAELCIAVCLAASCLLTLDYQWYSYPSHYQNQNQNVSRHAKWEAKLPLLWTYLCFITSGLKGTDKKNGVGYCEKRQWSWENYRKRDILFIGWSSPSPPAPPPPTPGVSKISSTAFCCPYEFPRAIVTNCHRLSGLKE